jgi:PHD/YefM family antitoxin component YafN of YafNO toxin-antitoxin module
LGKTAAPSIHRIAITKARINLGQVARRAHVNKEYFILEKGGIPVAGILSADELEDYLDLQDRGIRAQIRRSNEDIRAGRTRPATALLAESDSSPRRRRKPARRKA